MSDLKPCLFCGGVPIFEEIEVLKRGTRHRIICPECGRLLAYWENDVRYIGDYRDDNPRFIKCPVFKSEIKIPKSEESNE